MRAPAGSTAVLVLLLLLAASGGRVAHGETGSGDEPAGAATAGGLERTCDLGITYALSGQAAAAESSFISLLSRSPGVTRGIETPVDWTS